MRLPTSLALVPLTSLVALGCGGNKPATLPDASPTPPDGGSHQVHVTTTNYYTGAKANIEFLAIQDGDGAWQVVHGTNGEYTAPITGDRYAVMTACHDGPDFSDTSIYYRHVSDGAFALFTCDTPPTDQTVTFDIKNLPADANVRLRFDASGFNLATAYANGPIARDVAAGPLEGVAIVRANSDLHPIGFVRIPKTTIAGATTITLDLATAAPATSTALTLNRFPSADAIVTTSLRTASDNFSLVIGDPQTGAYHYTTPPASFLAGDRYAVSASTSDGRTATTRVSTLAPLTLAAPTAAMTATATLVEAPYLRPVVTFSTATKELTNQSYEVLAYTDATMVYATYTPAWIGTATTVTFATPDFSTLAGYPADVELAPRAEIDWSATRFEDDAATNTAVVQSLSASAGGTLGHWCGDGHVDQGETCDDAGESATCDSDCTKAECGDGVTNFSAGEDCDPPDGTTCDASCKAISKRAPITAKPEHRDAGALPLHLRAAHP